MFSILHIERSASFRAAIEAIVRKKGLEYHAAPSLRYARTLLEQESVNLIFTGIELEDGSGEDLVKDLSSSVHRDIPVVVITASDSLELRERLFNFGVMDYMLKQDATPERLGSYIDAFLRGDALIERLRGLNIAVLDDSEISLSIVRHIFRLNSIPNLTCFRDPEELLSSKDPQDIYLIDIVLPDISGEEVILNLRNANPGAIIIAMSSISNTRTISQVLLSGADDYIIKPFDAQIFLARLKTAVRVYWLMTDLQKAKEELQTLADYDGLTELFNHRKIMTILNKVQIPSDDPELLAVVIFDLDDFKQINDNYGHQTGDEVLKSFATLLHRRLSPIGSVGRYGGEEFLAVVGVPDRDELEFVLHNLYAELGAMKFGREELRVTVSGGVSFLGNGDREEEVQRADQALYAAKAAGKDCFRFALPT